MSAGASRRLALAGTVAAVVVAADQITKTWAEDQLSPASSAGRHVAGPLWLRLTYNTGAAFGIGRGVTPVVEAVVAVLVVGLLVAGGRVSHRASQWEAVAVGLLAGGALSNLADRVFRDHGGAVIDFIDAAQIGRREYWPVFNVADSCIVVGAVLLAVRLSLTTRHG